MTTEEVCEKLAAPFTAAEVKFKPAVVSGHRALALAYVDARVVQDRLDEVLGVAGWQDDYELLPDGSVVCRLRIRLAGEWLTKVDVGGPSEQPDEGDKRKAAFSDALKRAAVKFGIGRYLYRTSGQWVDYDPHKRQFVRPPQLAGAAGPTATAPAGKRNGQAPAEEQRLSHEDQELLTALLRERLQTTQNESAFLATLGVVAYEQLPARLVGLVRLCLERSATPVNLAAKVVASVPGNRSILQWTAAEVTGAVRRLENTNRPAAS